MGGSRQRYCVRTRGLKPQAGAQNQPHHCNTGGFPSCVQGAPSSRVCRVLTPRSFAALGALAFVACAPAAESLPIDCGQFESCDTCTPQLGGRWCGVPGRCSIARLRRVWNPSECGASTFPGCVPEDTSGLNPCGYLRRASSPGVSRRTGASSKLSRSKRQRAKA